MEVTDNINSIVQDLLNRYKKAISDSGHIASGQLENTASYKVMFNGKYLDVYFNLQEYWKYLENGTRPHFPPIEPIERWITVKHIVPRTNGGNIPTTKQLAFLIAREISKNGTKPTKLLQQTIDSSDDLINMLIVEITQQLENEINKDIENITEE